MGDSASAVAARLKLKRPAPAPSESELPSQSQLHREPPPPESAAAPGITEGATVLGNFKGLGDWDEALVVACLPDGTYVLEYVDEGLIEEGVPASRVKLPSNTSAQNAQEEEGNDGNDAVSREFVEGETVLGNFKGLGDWDEALVVACLPDGTYVLEYVDEGLIEERVPASRIEKMGGADAEAQASMAAGGMPLPTLSDETRAASGGGGDHERPDARDKEESSNDDDDDLLASTEDFIPCVSWRGAKQGYCFKAGDSGVGYYKDVPLLEAYEEAERRKLVLTAPQLANWAVELLEMPPSLQKADRYFGLFDLAHLRVSSLFGHANKAPPALFPSLSSWFDAQLPLLAERLPPQTIETTLRVFLAPKQSLQLGQQQVTFTVDWVKVSGPSAALEPISSALLKKLGLGERRPQRVLMVVMYRTQHNRITNVWADIDKEGLGLKKGAKLDDVLMSDAFDRALELARKGGAQGSLEPTFHNYHDIETVG